MYVHVKCNIYFIYTAKHIEALFIAHTVYNVYM